MMPQTSRGRLRDARSASNGMRVPRPRAVDIWRGGLERSGIAVREPVRDVDLRVTEVVLPLGRVVDELILDDLASLGIDDPMPLEGRVMVADVLHYAMHLPTIGAHACLRNRLAARAMPRRVRDLARLGEAQALHELPGLDYREFDSTAPPYTTVARAPVGGVHGQEVRRHLRLRTVEEDGVAIGTDDSMVVTLHEKLTIERGAGLTWGRVDRRTPNPVGPPSGSLQRKLDICESGLVGVLCRFDSASTEYRYEADTHQPGRDGAECDAWTGLNALRH
jgi:hypothetical protein